MQQQIELLRAIPYTSVGLANGNPPGTLAASTNTTLPSGEAVKVTYAVTWVNDKVPENPYQTNADYKKVVLSIVRTSDSHVLDSTTTFVAAASAPPSAGTTWVQVKRTVQDAVTGSPIVGANVNLTGGPKSENRNDTTDASGTVLFPALTGGGATPFTLVTTYTGYSVYPDDLSPGSPSSIPPTQGLNSIGTIRMYQPTSLTINLQDKNGNPWTSAASTVTVDSSRCGKQSIALAAGVSSTTVTTCDTWNGKTVNLPPNVSGQTPAFDKYFVTINSGSNWGATSSSGVLVPSGYPTTLTQTVNVKMSATTYSSTKAFTVTVTKSGSADPNARVEVTGGPASIYLYGVTNGSGQVTFTVPVTSTSSTYTINANDMGLQKGSTTTSCSTTSCTPSAPTVAIS
jgi:hypothetical protein